jgi:LPXTG-motif cell wall-anchored protein
VSSRLVLLALILVAALAVTGAPAWAQSAGDEQYDDPFAGQEDQGSSAQPAPTPAPSAPAAAPAAAAPAAAPAATASAAQLPRTGTDTLLTALAGLGLVMAGVGLRLRVPADGG